MAFSWRNFTIYVTVFWNMWSSPSAKLSDPSTNDRYCVPVLRMPDICEKDTFYLYSQNKLVNFNPNPNLNPKWNPLN